MMIDQLQQGGTEEAMRLNEQLLTIGMIHVLICLSNEGIISKTSLIIRLWVLGTPDISG